MIARNYVSERESIEIAEIVIFFLLHFRPRHQGHLSFTDNPYCVAVRLTSLPLCAYVVAAGDCS